jgi:hypothetical protein
MKPLTLSRWLTMLLLLCAFLSIEAFGNDPDSGFQPIHVGTKA